MIEMTLMATVHLHIIGVKMTDGQLQKNSVSRWRDIRGCGN